MIKKIIRKSSISKNNSLEELINAVSRTNYKKQSQSAEIWNKGHRIIVFFNDDLLEYTITIENKKGEYIFTDGRRTKDEIRELAAKEAGEYLSITNPIDLKLDLWKLDLSELDSLGDALEQRVNFVIKSNTHKSFNKDSIYARIVVDDLKYSWERILFKDKGKKGYLIKITSFSDDREMLKICLDKQIKKLNYPFPVETIIRKSYWPPYKLIISIPFYK